MFQEAVDHVAEFIGTQPHDTGCSSVDLGEFITRDVAPYCGQTGSPAFRDGVVLLLLSQYAASIHVYQMPASSLAAHGPASAGPSPAADTGRRRGVKGARVAAATSPIVAIRAEMRHAKEVTIDEVNTLLSEGRIVWQAAASSATRPSSNADAMLLRFVPKPALREKALGFSVHTESMFMTANFLCDHALQGWATMQNTPEAKARYKQHLVNAGLRRLRQRQIISAAYVIETEPKVWVTTRWFPIFAAPLTEPEKTECATSEGAAGQTSRATPSSSSPIAPLANASSGVEETGLTPTEFVAYRGKRGNSPLNRYFARCRCEDASFPSVVLDLGVIRRVVKSSAEGSLVLQDATHAILAAHGKYGLDISKSGQLMLRRAMVAAGLRVVWAWVPHRGKARRIRLVMPIEDLLRNIQLRSAKEQRQRRRRLRHHSKDQEAHRRQVGNEEAAAAEAAAGPLSEDDSAEDAFTSTDKLVEVEEVEGDPDNPLSDRDDNGDDGEEAASSGKKGRRSGEGAATQGGRSIAGKQAAFLPFYCAVGVPLDLQLGGEAERRPLALTAVFPKVILETPEKVRKACIATALEGYMKNYHTVEVHSVVQKGKKAFATVYMLREDLQAAEGRSTKGAKDEPHARDEESATAANGTNFSAAPAATLRDIEPQDGSEAKMAAATTTESLPKGLSPFAVEAVLEALHNSPRHAATINYLGTVISGTTLTRRVLPYLRSQGKVVSTGVTPRGKRRIGIIALANVTLTDQEKMELVAEEAARAEGGPEASLDTATTEEVIRNVAGPQATKSWTTDIVLEDVPAAPEGVEGSKEGQRLRMASNRAKSTVGKLLLVRNGYSRHSLCRAGRLHVELWKQWHECAAALRDDGLPASPPEKTQMMLRSVYDNMSLSTFCIVVGFSAFDLASVLGIVGKDLSNSAEDPRTKEKSAGGAAKGRQSGSRKQTRITDFFGATPNAGSAGNATHNSDPDGANRNQGISWSTPLQALPPSVQAWCTRQGYGSLRLALQLLQQRGLITCDTCIDPFLETPLLELSISLRSVAVRENHTYTFYNGGSEATSSTGSLFTPSSTAYAVLRYWQPEWCCVSYVQSGIVAVRDAMQVAPDMSFPQLAAMSRVLRKDPGAIAEFVYQRQGWVHWSRTPRLPQRPGSLNRLTRPELSMNKAKALRRQRARRLGGGGVGRGARRRVHEAPRVSISGGAIEEALAAALASANPRRKVEDVANLLDRLRRRTWLQRVLSVAAGASCSSDGRGKGAERWLLSFEPSAAWLGGFDTGALHASAVDATVLAVLGSTEYDRDTPNSATPHSGILACTLKEVFMTCTKLNGGSTLRSRDGVAFDMKAGSAEILPLLQRVFSPCALLPPLPNAVAVPDASSTTDAGAPLMFQTNTASQQLVHNISSAACRRATTTSDTGAVVGSSSSACFADERSHCDLDSASQSFELAADALRMILLSDHAHYRGDIARDLLLAFPKGCVQQARAFLLECPSFRSSQARGRLPKLTLATRPYIFSTGLLKSMPRPCANAALLHGWAACLDATATAASRGAHHAAFAANPFAAGADAMFDVSVTEQPTMDVQAIVAANAELTARRSDNAGGMSQQQQQQQQHGGSGGGGGSVAALRHRIEDSMRGLRLPVMAWSQRGVRLEASQLSAAREEEAQAAKARAHRNALAARKRGRTEEATNVEDGQGDGAVKEEGNADEEDPAEDDDDGMIHHPHGLSAGDAAASLYPSRTLLLCDGDVGEMEGIPVALPASAAERGMVASTISHIREGRNDTEKDEEKASQPRYPSPFHHVDGTLNEYVWRYTLLCVYRCVLRVPGVAETDLCARMTASGLLGPRSFRFAINFLCASGVLVRSVGEVTKPSPFAGSPLRPGGAPPLRRTRREEAVKQFEAYYTATVCPSGLWDMTKL